MSLLYRCWTFICQRCQPLTLILLLHILLGLGFNLALPIYEGLDEPNHFLYIRYIQLYHALPIQGLDRAGPRAHHPPAYFVLGALATAWIPMSGTAEKVDMQPNPKFYFRFDDPHIDNKAYTVWTPGRVFVDTYRLTLPADAPTVDDAQILLGLGDGETMQRLPVTGRNAGPPEDAWVEFGAVRVGP